MKVEDNAVNYTATMFFEAPEYAVSFPNVEAASNTPQYNWIFSANVLCKKRNQY